MRKGVLPQNPWALRHEEEFTGRRYPFGCGVYFKPAITKYSVDKACARARFGILGGYRLSPGCRWNGEYLVGDLGDFVDLDPSEDASARGIQIYEHVTKVVTLPAVGISFPLKARYEFINATVEGARFSRYGEGAPPGIVVVPEADSGPLGAGLAGDEDPTAGPPPRVVEEAPVPILDDRGEVVHWGVDAQGSG